MNLNELITEWQSAKAELEGWKHRESELRQEILKLGFGYNPDACESGTRTLPTDDGYKLKALFKVAHSVDQAKVNDVMTRIASFDAVGQHYANKLLKQKFELDVKTYKDLPPAIKVIADEMITTKSSTPSLTIID